jgi:hypothetical protein
MCCRQANILSSGYLRKVGFSLIFTFTLCPLFSDEIIKSEYVSSRLVRNKNLTYKLESIKQKKDYKKNQKDILNILSDSLSNSKKSTELESLLRQLYIDWKSISLDLQIKTLEITYALYENEFYEEIETIIPFLRDEKLISISILYLERADEGSGIEKLEILSKTNRPILNQLSLYFKEEFIFKEEYLGSLFDFQFAPSIWKFYSLQRANRDYTGLLMIQKPDGQFLKNSDGTIFSIPQLARSVTNLPYFIKNGNTPSGVYSILGVSNSNNPEIGPIPVLKLGLPFEIDIRKFSKNDYTKWTLEAYLNHFPLEWRGLEDIKQSYIAGQLGRTGIWAHGSTLDSSFYKDKKYYPLLPTFGCMSAYEQWNSDGSLIKSDQQKLINIIKKEKIQGLYYVIDLNDDKREVSIEDIKPIIAEYVAR